MEFSLYEIMSGIAMTLYLVRCWLTKTFDHWRKRNIVGPKPIPFFGTCKDVALNRTHAVDYVKSIYDAYPDEPAVGLFARSVPVLLVKDPRIIKDVLIKSFLTFPNRGFKIHEDIEPLAQHLMFLEYKRWKPLRIKLTPAFAHAQLQEMFQLLEDCAEHFVRYIDNLVAKGEPIECRELAASFTTDVIGSCAFGLNMTDVKADKSSEFRKIVRELFADSWINKLRFLIRTLPHWLAVMLKPIVGNEKMIDLLVDIVKRTMDDRRTNDVRRHDFIDQLMDLKNPPEQAEHRNMSDISLTAQAFVFLAAGFETSSTTMSNALHELALNSDIQDKLREEINAIYKENNEKLSHETLKNMNYLDQVVNETLRKYPPAFGIVREAADDHMFEESRILISKGTSIFIPTHAIHHDPDIYPEPEKFDPTRFDEESIKSRPHMTFLPFGKGPRNCIGEQFARNQIKLGLAAAIRHFKFETCGKPCKVYKKRFRCLLLIPDGNLYLKIDKLSL